MHDNQLMLEREPTERTQMKDHVQSGLYPHEPCSQQVHGVRKKEARRQKRKKTKSKARRMPRKERTHRKEDHRGPLTNRMKYLAEGKQRQESQYRPTEGGCKGERKPEADHRGPPTNEGRPTRANKQLPKEDSEMRPSNSRKEGTPINRK